MRNTTAIELINRIVNPNTDHLVYTASEALAAVMHGYLYVKPGEDTDEFLDGIRTVLSKWSGECDFPEEDDGIPYEEWIGGMIATETLAIARSLFNEEYFEGCIEFMESEEEEELNCFRDFTKTFDVPGYKELIRTVDMCKLLYDAYFSDEDYYLMRSEFDEMFVAHGLEIPNSQTGGNAYAQFAKAIPYYILEYLDRKSVIETVCRHLDNDSGGLTYMDRVLKYVDVHSAMGYMELATAIQYDFEMEIFSPIITDPDRVLFDSLANGQAVELSHNEWGQCMLGAMPF